MFCQAFHVFVLGLVSEEITIHNFPPAIKVWCSGSYCPLQKASLVLLNPFAERWG